MLRLISAFYFLVLTAQAQSTGDQFFSQHRAALMQRFGSVASEGELQYLTRFILDRQHTDVEPNEYFRPNPAPLSHLLAQKRGQSNTRSLAEAIIYPLLRYVLPHAIVPPSVSSGAPAGERIAAGAYRYLGVRYGSPTYSFRTDRGALDCSGLVNRVLADLEIGYKPGGGTGATERIVSSSSFRTVSSPQPGDLLLRQHGGRWRHVGIYVGGGHLIEAPYRGTVIRKVAYHAEKWKRIIRLN
jgi:cell wall-associated NlpC family hydrolase